MPRFLNLLPLLMLLPLAGCYTDQQKQLASCEASAVQGKPGEPLRSIVKCMDDAGYHFVAWDTHNEETIVCDMAAIVRGQPSMDGTDALCFEPKGWLALKIFHFEVPTKKDTSS